MFFKNETSLSYLLTSGNTIFEISMLPVGYLLSYDYNSLIFSDTIQLIKCFFFITKNIHKIDVTSI